MRTKMRTWAAVGVALAAALCGCGGGFPAIVHQTRVTTQPSQDGQGLHVQTGLGSIEIVERPERSDIGITAELTGNVQERLEAAELIAERDADGTLLVGVRWPGGERLPGERCSFKLEVPDAHQITARTSNGPIGLVGFSGGANLDTSNGPITVHNHHGPLVLKTSNGGVVVQGCTGEISASSSNGFIDIRSATGPVKAETSNSSVSVSLTDGNPGPVEIDTSNGRVDLRVGPAFRGRLRAETSNGDVDLGPFGAGFDVQVQSGQDHAAQALFGGAEEPSSNVETSNGSIRIQPLSSGG